MPGLMRGMARTAAVVGTATATAGRKPPPGEQECPGLRTGRAGGLRPGGPPAGRTICTGGICAFSGRGHDHPAGAIGRSNGPGAADRRGDSRQPRLNCWLADAIVQEP